MSSSRVNLWCIWLFSTTYYTKSSSILMMGMSPTPSLYTTNSSGDLAEVYVYFFGAPAELSMTLSV